MFPSSEYRYIIEEEKSNDPPPFDWLRFYHREMPEEVEEAIQTLEKELLQSVKIEKGPQVPLDLLWINKTLLAQALQERKSFGRVLREAFRAWREEETRRWSIMDNI